VWARPPLEAEQKNLEHSVEFATVNLQLTEEYKEQLNPPAPSISTPDSQRSGRGLLQCVGNHPGLCFVSCRIRAYAADLAGDYSSHLGALAPISPLAGRRRMRKLSELRDLEVWRRDAPSSAGRMRRGWHPQMSPELWSLQHLAYLSLAALASEGLALLVGSAPSCCGVLAGTT
jgi:hypothetical protein